MGEPRPTVDLKLDPDTGDLVLVDRDLVLITGAELVRQRLWIALRLFRGEWFLDAEAGVPWFQSILKKGVAKGTVDELLRERILGVTDVNRILTYSSDIDAAARIISVAFAVDSVYGPVDFEGALI